MDVSTAPRVERTINGFTLSVPQPYAAGQVLTDATASMLNQTFAENISNNTRAALKAGVVLTEGAEATPHTVETAQSLIDSYVTEYEPGVRRGGGGEARVVDPVEREARKIAKAKAIDLVKQAGHKVGDMDMGPIVDRIFEKNRDVLMAEGKKIVRANELAREKSGSLDLGDLDLTAKPAAEPTA